MLKSLSLATAIILTSSFLGSLPLYAGDFHLEASTIGQVRENERDQREVPVNGYLGMSIDLPKSHIWAETDMRIFRDFTQKLDDYDLYQAVLHYRPLEIFQLDFGRQFVSQGFFVEVMDGIQMIIMPKGIVDITVYAGMPRSVEVGDFNKDDGLITGLSLGLKNIPRTNAQIHAVWRKDRFRRSNFKQNDEIFVGANLSHQFKGKTTPLLYGMVEYDVSGRVMSTGTAGLDIYPHSRIALNAEFNYFNVNHNTNRRSIHAIFTRGPMYSGRFASTWAMIEDVLDFVQTYSYQWEEVQVGIRRHSHLLDTAFQFSFDNIGLYVEPGVYYSRSYGGQLIGARVFLHEQFTDEWYLDFGVDYSNYSKITNVDDYAISVTFWTGYEVVKGLTISGGVEFNKNTFFKNETRGSFKVEYAFDQKIK